MSNLIKSIPEFYVGFKNQGANEPPLAFLTPYDTTAAFNKRKETVDNWAHGYGRYVNGQYVYDPHPEAKVIPNEPLAGYKISESVKRTGGWNGGNVVWRIVDPRGFEWEITSNNLSQIITQTGISAGGVINGRCIIARVGSTNLLVPEGTDLWDQMKADDGTRKKKAAAKTVTGYMFGDSITLKNGRKGYYFGHEHMMMGKQYPSKPGPNAPTTDRYHLFVEKTSYGWYRVFAYKTIQVIEFDASDRLTTGDEASIRKKDNTTFSFAGAPPVENAHITRIA